MQFEVNHAVVLALGVFIGKELWSWLKGHLSQNTKAVQDNTHAIIKLEVHIESLLKQIASLPALKADIDSAHAAIRRIDARQPPPPRDVNT